MRLIIRAVTFFFLLFLSVSTFAAGGSPQFGQRREAPNQWEIEKAKEMEKARAKERQKNLQKDTTKLLELATELKQYVDRTTEHTLSLEVIRKCEEIDKLAKDIQKKMKGE